MKKSSGKLNILLVIEKNSWIDPHIGQSLEAMGHTVHRFYYGDYVGEFYGRKRKQDQLAKNKQLLQQAAELKKNHQLDMIFCYVYDDFLLPAFAKRLANLDLPFLNYNVDMACQWYRITRTARYFTAVLCAQRDNMETMKSYASRVIHFPMAARNVPLANPAEILFAPAAAVTFLGTPTTYRTRVLSILAQHAMPLAIYGKYWKNQQIAKPNRNFEKLLSDIWHYGLPRMKAEGMRAIAQAGKRRFLQKEVSYSQVIPDSAIHEFLPNEALSQLFQHSLINLGFTRMTNNNPYQLGTYQMRLRDFEVPFAGGFYLLEKAPGYDEFFKPDEEIVTWSNPHELIEKINYYLSNDTARQQIAKAGQKRAQSEHTWSSRFNKLFLELGI